MKIEAYAGIDPARKRCCAVGEADAELVMDSLREGLIIVPVSLETARSIWGSEPVDVYAIAGGTPTAAPAFTVTQIERVRKIVQEVATDESVSFDEAFTVAMNHLAYWVSEMPKGRKFSGGGSSHASSSHPDQPLD